MLIRLVVSKFGAIPKKDFENVYWALINLNTTIFNFKLELNFVNFFNQFKCFRF